VIFWVLTLVSYNVNYTASEARRRNLKTVWYDFSTFDRLHVLYVTVLKILGNLNK